MKRLRSSLLLTFCFVLFGCDSQRLSQFSSFAAAGTLYVQSFHQLTAEAGTALIAGDSATLITARAMAGPALTTHAEQFSSNILKNDRQLEEYLTTLQKLDAHANMLGSYFAAVTQLTSGSAENKVATAAESLLDSINTFNPEIEKATIGNQPIKNFIQPATTLIVDHFEVKALDEHLKKAAPAIDQALELQEAAVDALISQIKASQAASLEIRERTDVIDPYVASGNLAASWQANRDSFLHDAVTINGLTGAKAAISQLHATFRQLVQDKRASPDMSTLIADIEKISGYISAVKSTSSEHK